jgi:hypothetical protein
MCFSAPSMPAPPPPPPAPPPPPQEQDEAVKKARGTSKQKAALAGGRNATILTSAQGLTDDITTSGKTLLGM